MRGKYKISVESNMTQVYKFKKTLNFHKLGKSSDDVGLRLYSLNC